MAGASMGEDENPVGINVTPLVDIIFCLCVFFMISFKFKQIEGKFDTWLPKGKGIGGAGADSSIIEEIRIAMYWNEDQQRTTRKFRDRPVDDDDTLQTLVREAHADFVRLNKPDTPVTIDSAFDVPWDDVIRVVNLCKRENIDKIEFALGAPPAKPSAP
jgi:biopolymer transport protein ExbD